jgi:hypothetical protein
MRTSALPMKEASSAAAAKRRQRGAKALLLLLLLGPAEAEAAEAEAHLELAHVAVLALAAAPGGLPALLLYALHRVADHRVQLQGLLRARGGAGGLPRQRGQLGS